MYMGRACETWKWAKSWMWEIILLQGHVPRMGVADPTTQTHENSQSTTLKVHAWYFSRYHCQNFVILSVLSMHEVQCFYQTFLTLGFNTLIGFSYTTDNFATFCCFVKVNANLLLDGLYIHTYILLVWQSTCKNHLPFDKFNSSWYVTKNMTIIFVAQRFQIIASLNFLPQPPNCLLRFCRG
jgi:hypothetical protein